MKATGAKAHMESDINKGYYDTLVRSEFDYPNPSFEQIEVDLNRTFTDLAALEPEKYIPSLRRVLRAYVTRNPTVGYCQGMNFIVGRMLQYMNEEQAFWTLTMIIETMLPLDFYTNMLGALVDQLVFKKLIQRLLNRLHYHFKKLKFDPQMLSFEWLVCFFIHNLTPQVSSDFNTILLQASLRVWDLFMIKGIKALFGAAIALLGTLKDDLMEAQSFCMSTLITYPFFSKRLSYH